MSVASTRRTIGYVRVSTDKQDIGPEAQVASLTASADVLGWELELRREDAVSAASMRGRPVLAQALADLKAGRADVLAVSKLDRLSRDVADLASLLKVAERQGWAVVCLDLGVDTSTTIGRAMAHMSVTFAEMERRRIGERTREAMAQLPDDVRDRMRRGGRPRIIPECTAARIREMRVGGLSYSRIADALNAEGAPATGKQWWPETVRRLAQREAVA